MLIGELIKRFNINYELLSVFYKRGRFEEGIPHTDKLSDPKNFFPVSSEHLSDPTPWFGFNDQSDRPREGKERHPHDLEWATTNLRELAIYLKRYCENDPGVPLRKRRDVILRYFKTLLLSYEVSDYFLEVTDDASNFLIDHTIKITNDIDDCLGEFNDIFKPNSAERQELIKQNLIVALCGINELYRKHEYKNGLSRVEILKKLISESSEGHGRWYGLKGLCSYAKGKLHTAIGEFSQAEKEFRHSVEFYSESIWQKERDFSRFQEEIAMVEAAYRNKQIKQAEYKNKIYEFSTLKKAHELERAVALRRGALASCFGYAFQSLVMGKVKDSIRMSALVRGLINGNTGKIYSAYVDLIYYSAKRAENSSSRRTLLGIRKNLVRCHRTFKNLIPAAHYKNRALFQISLVDHYLARWYNERGIKALTEPVDADKGFVDLRKAERYWNLAHKSLDSTIVDATLSSNKRLRAESMAIAGHVLSNLALLAWKFDGDGLPRMEEADSILKEAWVEAAEHPHIRCEIGLAQAAVGKAKVEYISRSPDESSPVKQLEISDILNKSRKILHEILDLNDSNNIRVQATAYLRLAEIALLQKGTRLQAREYYEEYVKISAQVEHDFCHRWARELRSKIVQSGESFTFTVVPGPTFVKQKFEEQIDEMYREYAVSYAAAQIEKDFARQKVNKRKSLNSYLTAALTENFGLSSNLIREWIDKYDMYDKVRLICSHANDLPELAPQGKKK